MLLVVERQACVVAGGLDDVVNDVLHVRLRHAPLSDDFLHRLEDRGVRQMASRLGSPVRMARIWVSDVRRMTVNPDGLR